MTLKNVVSPINKNIEKSNTQNTEDELYLRIGKIGNILNWGSSKIISRKKLYSPSVINANFCPIEAATGKVLYKTVFIKISQSLQDNTRVEFSFLTKLQGGGLQFSQKRDSNTGLVLWILQSLELK